MREVDTRKVRELMLLAQYWSVYIADMCDEVDTLRKEKEDLITALESAMHVIEEHPIRRAHATELEFSRKLCNHYYELKRKKWDHT